MTKKSSFIAVCGAPNAGKSTLVNRIVGAKVSIVSPRPQTTRVNIKGIAVFDETQLVFIDTPGIMKAKGSRMRKMVDFAWEGIGEADQILFILDAEKGMNDFASAVLENLKSKELRGFAVLNKIDLVDHAKMLELAKMLFDTGLFEEVFMTSIKKDIGVDDVIKHLVKAAKPGQWYYPEDQISDKNDRFLAEETTREKIFYLMQQEIPYGVDIETDSYKEDAKSVTIHQSIIVPRETHKTMIIGKKGDMLKQIGIKSRLELEKLLDCKVNLFLHVKVREAKEG
jgi:GTP-binding protein Era